MAEVFKLASPDHEELKIAEASKELSIVFMDFGLIQVLNVHEELILKRYHP